MRVTEVVRSGGASALRGKAVNGVRRAAHLRHETRLLKSVASDALEDGAYNARRVWRRSSRGLVDWRDEAAHRVRRQPFAALGAAAGLGLALGAGVSWLVRKAR